MKTFKTLLIIILSTIFIRFSMAQENIDGTGIIFCDTG
jgi:hypothetical protein